MTCLSGDDESAAGFDQLLRDAEWRFRSLVRTAPVVILHLAPDGRILEFNPEAERVYGCSRQETLGQNYLEKFILDRDRAAVADDIREVLGGRETRGYENLVRCSDGSERLLTWNVSRVLDDRRRPTGIVAVGQDITEKAATHSHLRRLTNELRERVKELNCLFELSELIEHCGSDWEAVARGMLAALRNSWQYPEITCVRIAIEQREFQTDNYRPARWTQQEEIQVSGQSVGSVAVGYLEERPAADEGPFLKEERPLLAAVAKRLGRLLERIRIEGALVRVREEIAVREQQRIGQELHDGLGQELTGLGYLAESLYHDLQKQGAGTAVAAEKLSVGLQHALERTKTVARGLAPLGPGTDGLIAALKELARTTQERWNIGCRLLCRRPPSVEDVATTTQLFRIVQEAVNNAAKHGRAKQIEIALGQRQHGLLLQIRDDGIGIPPNTGQSKGMGLRTMQDRAALAQARLSIRRARGGGTVVTCLLDPGASHG